MHEPYKRFKRAQKAAELRAKELEAEKNDYPLYYITIPREDPEDQYPFVKVEQPFKNDAEIMAYVNELILDEGDN
jgi:hypothetical protein